MSKAPDVTDPDDIRGLPDDPRVDRFKNNPVLVVIDATERASLYHLTAHEQEGKG
jgi:hypothetical protein